MKAAITYEELINLLSYNPDTGYFYWKSKPNKKIVVGQLAGYTRYTTQGYTFTRLNKIAYQAHRLAWLYVYGEWPKHFIDHKNGIRNDNRIKNLRDVSAKENSLNNNSRRYKNACNRFKDSF